MTNRFAGPAEPAHSAPGLPWTIAAILVVPGADPDDEGAARPIGLAVPGDVDGASFSGDALDDGLVIRQLRCDPVEVRLPFERVAVGGAGASLDRLEIVATIALDGRDRWLGLERELRALAREVRVAQAGQPADARGGDRIDDRLVEVLETGLESFVRGALASAAAGAAREGSLAHAILPAGPAVLAGSFSISAVRVLRASWAGAGSGELFEHVQPAPQPAGDLGHGADGEAPGDVEVAAEGAPTEVGAGDGQASGTALVPALPDDAADAPLAPVLGSSPALAEAWAREAGDAGVAAIGGVMHAGRATVLVLHEDPSRVILSSGLAASLGRALDVSAPRLLLLPVPATLRELLETWLAEQAPPEGTSAAVVLDDAQRRVVLELSGPGAADFVQGVVESGSVDLAVLGAVLPWSISLRAMGDDGLVEADGSGGALARGGPGGGRSEAEPDLGHGDTMTAQTPEAEQDA